MAGAAQTEVGSGGGKVRCSPAAAAQHHPAQRQPEQRHHPRLGHIGGMAGTVLATIEAILVMIALLVLAQSDVLVPVVAAVVVDQAILALVVLAEVVATAMPGAARTARAAAGRMVA